LSSHRTSTGWSGGGAPRPSNSASRFSRFAISVLLPRRELLASHTRQLVFDSGGKLTALMRCQYDNLV
jgi:hypothetical protein